MTQKEQWLRRLVRRLQLGLFLQRFVDGGVIFCLTAGVVFLVVKLLWPVWWPATQYLLLAAIPLVPIAYWLSRRSMYSPTQMVALLDRRIGAGGLLMTLMEQPDENWESQLPARRQDWLPGLPPIRPVRLLKHLSIPFLFLLAAFFLPPRDVPLLSAQPSAISLTQTEQLEELLKQLNEADVLEPEDSEELQAEIEKLRDETEFTPLTHEDWAAVDAMRESMQVAAESRRNRVAQAASSISDAQQQLEESGALSEQDRSALQEKIDGLSESEESGQEGEGEIGEEAEGQGGESKGSGGKSTRLGSKIGNSKCKGKLSGDPQELKEALEELSELIESECDKLNGL